MSRAKKERRERVRQVVYARAGGKCEVCGKACDDLDPHHITPRHQMPNAGLVPSNLIGLCAECHEHAEDVFHVTAFFTKGAMEALGLTPEVFEMYQPSALYQRIGSSYDKALNDSEADR